MTSLKSARLSRASIFGILATGVNLAALRRCPIRRSLKTDNKRKQK